MFDFINYLKDSMFFVETNKIVIGKTKDESERKLIDEFVGIKWKMLSMKNVDGKESNTVKRVNIATEFSEFKTFYLIKKYLDIKWEESKAKT